jgi:hypothetical protein
MRHRFSRIVFALGALAAVLLAGRAHLKLT